MSVNPEQNYTVAAIVFEDLDWHGEGRRETNKKYMPGRPGQHATIIDPKDVVEAAFGTYAGELPEADAELKALLNLQKSLEANIGKIMLLKSGGWEDTAQNRTRLFSPLPGRLGGNVLEFGVKTATPKSGGFRGWSTTMEVPALADVYDIFYENTDIAPTTIGYPLYKTHRVRGSTALRTEILKPVSEIQLVTNPDEVSEVIMAEHPNYGGELLEMMEDTIVHLQRTMEPA